MAAFAALLVIGFYAGFVHTILPPQCIANFRWDDCGKPPQPVIYYWKKGSRCEVGIWRGCLPNINMFRDEFECVSTCTFTVRAAAQDFHELNKAEEDITQNSEETKYDEKITPSEEAKQTPSEEEKQIPTEEEDKTSPIEDETTQPIEDETTQPIEDETTTSIEGETTTPIEEETTTPIEEETTTHIEEEKQTPNEDEKQTSGKEGKQTPNEDEKQTPSEDEKQTSGKEGNASSVESNITTKEIENTNSTA